MNFRLSRCPRSQCRYFLNEDLIQNIVPFGTSFRLGVIVVRKPPIPNRFLLCDGRCLLDDYHDIHNRDTCKILKIRICIMQLKDLIIMAILMFQL